MITPIQHQQSEFALRTVDYFSHDSLPRPYEKKITYTFNSHGFRADEFSNEDSVLFLGCSLTLGEAVTLEDSWAFQVSQALKLANYNLGISGGSNDSAFRLGQHYIPQLKPKLVVFMSTFTNRLDLITSTGIGTISVHSIDIYGPSFGVNKYSGQFYQEWIMNEENLNLNYQRNLNALSYICHINNVKLVTTSYWSSTLCPPIDYGRDQAHPGIQSNLRATQHILNQIESDR